jgi:hypothetical protein
MGAQRYPSPDGMFALEVDPEDGTVGFEGHYWRIDVEQLSAFRVDPPIATVTDLLDALAERVLVIVVSRFEDSGDEIRDIWITHDAQAEHNCRDEGESLEFRYWDGERHRVV